MSFYEVFQKYGNIDMGIKLTVLIPQLQTNKIFSIFTDNGIYRIRGHLRDPLDLSYIKKNYIFENGMITGIKWDTCGVDKLKSENYETPYFDSILPSTLFWWKIRDSSFFSICIQSEDEADEVCPLQDLPGGGVYPWKSTEEEIVNRPNVNVLEQGLNSNGIYGDPRFFGLAGVGGNTVNTGIFRNTGVFGNNGVFGNTNVLSNTGGFGVNNRWFSWKLNILKSLAAYLLGWTQNLHKGILSFLL